MAQSLLEDVRILLASDGHLISYKIKYLNLISSIAGTFLTYLTLAPHNDMPNVFKFERLHASNDLTLKSEDLIKLLINPVNKHEGVYILKKSHTLLPLSKGDIVEVTMKSHHELFTIHDVRENFLARLLWGKYGAREINNRRNINLDAIGTTSHGWVKVLAPKLDLLEFNNLLRDNAQMVIRLPEPEKPRTPNIVKVYTGGNSTEHVIP